MPNPLWLPQTDFPKLTGDKKSEIVIVGGGIAGVMAAYSLSKEGHGITLIEREKLAYQTTGSSAGTLFPGVGMDMGHAITAFGREKAKFIWDESAKAVAQIEPLIAKDTIDCGFKKPGAIMVPLNESEHGYLENEQKAMKSLGYKADLMTGREVKEHFAGREFYSGLLMDCPLMKPGLFVAELSKILDCNIYENTEMVGFEEKSEGVVVKTERGNISCDQLIVATNTEPFYGLEEHFTGIDNTNIPSRALGDKLSQLWPGDKIIWTIGDEEYDLFYHQGDRTVIELYKPSEIDSKTSYYFPGIGFDKKLIFWGEWARTEDWLPIAGRVSEHVSCAIAMGDQGIVMGTTCGTRMPKLIKNEPDRFLDLVSPKRFQK
jgi:glycine/D-amino acid oxidase-like deaminating enzyme